MSKDAPPWPPLPSDVVAPSADAGRVASVASPSHSPPDSSSAPSSSSLDDVDRARAPISRDFPPRFVSSVGESSRTARLAPGGVDAPLSFAPVGVGAGAVTAPFDALESTPERFPGGIKVDGTFAASGAGVEPKSVYAIGDIAAFPLAFDGNQIVRMEHVAHARASATHAAECILADSDTPYAYTPYFYSRVFEQVSFYFDLRMGD